MNMISLLLSSTILYGAYAADTPWIKASRGMKEIEGIEKKLAGMGLKFLSENPQNSPRLDVPFLYKARKKMGKDFDFSPPLAELETLKSKMRAFLEEFQTVAPQEVMEAYKTKMEFIGVPKEFLDHYKEASNSFEDFCEGRSAHADSVEFAAALARELGEGDCASAEKSLEEKFELVLDERKFSQPIQTLEPLRNAKNLKRVVIQGDPGKNAERERPLSFDSISSLKKLAFLEIKEVEMDFSSIKNLAHLKSLRIKNVVLPAPALSPLAELKSLISLDLVGCGIKDISLLKDFTGLKNLHLDQNQITDISPLGLLNLKEFSAEGNPIEVCPVDTKSKKVNDFCKRRPRS